MLHELLKALKEKQINIILHISLLLYIDCIMLQGPLTSSYEQVVTTWVPEKTKLHGFSPQANYIPTE
jgi:hypothetical protein